MAQDSLCESDKIGKKSNRALALNINEVKKRSVKRTTSYDKKIDRVLTPMPTKSRQSGELFININNVTKYQTISRVRSDDKTIERILTPKPKEISQPQLFSPFLQETFEKHAVIISGAKDKDDNGEL